MNAVVVSENKAIAQSGITGDLFNRWINYLDAKPKSIEGYTRAIRQFWRYLESNGIAEPTRQDILSYREYLKADHKPTTVQMYITSVKLFFQWTAQEGLYPNIAEHIKGARIDNEHKKDYLTSTQASNVLHTIDQDTLRGLRDYAIISLMLTTGLRTISIVRADIADVRACGDTMALYYQGKGRDEKAECVHLPEPVEKAIRDYLNARGETDSKAPLFTSVANRNSDERMTTRSISRLVKEALVDAGYNSDRLTAHSLRHTFATLNLLNGGTVEETQQILGHSSINTTMIYAHNLERATNNSEKRVAGAIFG